MTISFWLEFLVFFINFKSIVTYKPVVIIHGWKDTPDLMEPLVAFIKKMHPGTNVTLIHILHGLILSSSPIWYQVSRFGDQVMKISRANPEGIHLIGFSQGGVIARGIIETYPNHKVDTFISLAGAQGGIYGVTRYKPFIPFNNLVIANLYRAFYTPTGQLFSFAGYWKDPYHIKHYKYGNKFLPVINNEIKHTKSEEYKKNFLKIKRLVLIGSVNDTMITPWQSSHFAFYDVNGNIAKMEKHEIYTNDTFGLRTLDKRKAINILTVTGLDHADMILNEECVKNYVIPWLT